MRPYVQTEFERVPVFHKDVVYDLTEVLLASTGRLRYYGIVRTVAEIGMALHRQNPDIRFAIFSYAHDAMLEVFPTIDDTGAVDLQVPTGIRQLRLRRTFHTRSKLRDALLPAARKLIDYKNRKVWQQAGADLRPIDMTGKVLVSCGRPKLIVDILQSLESRGETFDLIPLLHDMIPLHDYVHNRASFPRNFLGDNRIAISKARALLTNSCFTRDEITRFHAQGEFPETAVVPDIHPIPLVHECPESREPLEQPLPERPYILAVGTSLGRKNVEAVFDALLHLHDTDQPVPDLVLAGNRRKRTDTYLQDPRFDPIRDRILFRESPNQADLVNLYKHAVALVISSRMEGWGLPAGEALWLGTPAVCAQVPALQEVCGDLGLYFDPDDSKELAGILARLMGDPGFDAWIRARIQAARPALRSWDDVGRDVLSALEMLEV